MPEPLEANLELSLTDALSSLDELNSATVEALTSAAESGADAIDSAIAAIPPIEIEADFADAQSQLELFDADATTPVTVPVESDTGEAINQLDLFTSYVEDNPPPPIPIELDTADAEEQLAELGDSASDATGGVEGLSGAATGLNAATGLATGSMAGLGGAIGSMGGTAGIAVGAVVGIAGATKMFFNEAVEATGSTQMFELALGDLADEVENLSSIKGLNTDIGTLALSLGSDDDKIRSVSARMFELATNSGKTREQASLFTQQLIAMGARAVAINPMLGDVGDVTERLSTAFVRGGRFASRYGLDLNQTEINAKALIMTHKNQTSELSFVEKSMAGAAIATEKYGENLDKVIARGSENAITVQRRLKQTITENIEALGMPLVAPIFDLMEAAIPVFAKAGVVIGAIAQVSLPLLIEAAEGASAALEGFIATFEVIIPVGEEVFGFLGGIPAVTEVAATVVALLAADWAISMALVATSTKAALGPIGLLAAIGFTVAKPIGEAIADLAVGLGIASRRGIDFDEVWGRVNKQAATFKTVTEGQLMPSFRALSAAVLDMDKKQHDGTNTLTHYTGNLKAFSLVAENSVANAQKIIFYLEKQGYVTTAYQRILDKTVGAQREQTAASAAEADATTLLTGTFEEQIAVLDKTVDAINAVYDVQFAAIHADEAERDAIDKLHSAKQDALKSGESTAAAQEAENRAPIVAEERILAASKAVRDKSESDHAGLGAAAAAEQATKDQVGALQALRGTLDPASDAGLIKFIDDYIAKLDTIPKEKKTEVQVWVDISGTQAQLDELDRVYQKFYGPNPQSPDGRYFPVLAAAEGMVVAPTPGGTLVNVGEAGATEIIVPTDDRQRARTLLTQGGLGDLVSRQEIDYDKLAAAVSKAIGGGPAPLIGTAYIGERDTIADLDYFMKTRMAGV